MSNALISWHVGTCGISDSDWNGNFYPRGLAVCDRLAYYATRFNSIELNTTFHSIPLRDRVRRWENVTPPNFRFGIKFPWEVTHNYPHQISEADAIEVAKRFFDVIQELGRKLAVILMQFPQSFSAVHRLKLLRLLDSISCPARLVVEFRDNSWWKPVTARDLQERGIGWAAADLGSSPRVAEIPTEEHFESNELRQIIPTSDFLYARWLGKHGQFPVHVREYFDSTPRITWWFERLTHVLEKHPNIRHVYAFFDNDLSGHAPTAARRFADKVNLPRFWETQSTLKQPTLFSLQNA
jgi:uncharacterized protein YecE (DUF72 family)